MASCLYGIAAALTWCWQDAQECIGNMCSCMGTHALEKKSAMFLKCSCSNFPPQNLHHLRKNLHWHRFWKKKKTVQFVQYFSQNISNITKTSCWHRYFLKWHRFWKKKKFCIFYFFLVFFPKPTSFPKKPTSTKVFLKMM
jgi:hypothetical protein